MSAVRAARVLLCLLAFVSLSAAHPRRAAAQADPLAVVTHAQYQLVPGERRIGVTVDATATSNMPDTATQRFYYDSVTFVVQPEATNFVASGEGAALAARVVEETEDYTAIEIPFSRPIFYQQSYAFRLTFDLIDAGGDPYRWLVVTRNFISLPVWAYGTQEVPGSSVTISVPGDYRASVEFGDMRMTPGDDRSTILSARDIADPIGYFSHVVVERRVPATLDQSFTVTLGDRPAEIRLRAWEDDQAWADAVQETLTVGLPALVEAIGLDYPIAGPLTVREAGYSRLGDYAGIYDEISRSIEMRFDAEPFVTLHEAAHIWFNGRLLDQRWIAEGFASHYGDAAGTAAGIAVEPFELTEELREHRIPLNAWGHPGAVDLDVEDFGYAASQHVAGEIAALAGSDGLRAVWQAVDLDELAYQAHSAARPETNPSISSEPWQRLLDLLEERTEASYVAIWEEWIVTDDEFELLDERAASREVYAELESAAGDWQLPRSLRLLMEGWQFEEAQALIDDAGEVLDAWRVLEDRAADAGLEPGRDVEARFEDGSMAGALGEARARLEAIDALESSAERLAAEPGVVERIGLIGERPDELLAEARGAFDESDEDRAVELAAEAVAIRHAAPDEGRTRVALAGGGLLAVDALIVGLLLRRIARRRGGRRAESGAG